MAGLSFAANEIDAKVEQALAADSMPEADRVRDRNRKPMETMSFLGLKYDMRGLELITV